MHTGPPLTELPAADLRHVAELCTPAGCLAARAVLVCDDDPDWRLLVREAFESAGGGGVTVHEVGDGHEALQFLRRQGCFADAPRPAMVCMDLEMPELNGLATLRAIKTDPGLRPIPTLLMSGVEDEEAMRRASRNGANAYVVKPESADRLADVVKRFHALWVERGPAGMQVRRIVRLGGPAESADTGHGRDQSRIPFTPRPDVQSVTQDVPPEPAGALGEPEGAPGRPRLQADAGGPRLLVVEDDADQRELLTETLEEHFGVGCVTLAPDCAAAGAVDFASFDLVLCDYHLPDGSGMDLLAEIRARCDVPVMMLTGANDADIAKQAILQGATDYIVKAGEYLTTIPLTVEKNLAMTRLARERAAATRSVADTLRRENAQLQERVREVSELAATDPMTGCYNRRAFEKVFAQMFDEAYRTGTDLACVMIDLDRFKQVNDTLGHAVGDELVRTAAAGIRTNLRQMDVVCRFGGDEFIVLLPGVDSGRGALVADRIRRDYAQAATRLVAGECKTMSIGIASVLTTSPRPVNAESLMVAADRALYEAKQSGRNQICAAA